MLLMVVAPELILIWAVRQFIAARKIMVTYNKERLGTSLFSKRISNLQNTAADWMSGFRI